MEGATLITWIGERWGYSLIPERSLVGSRGVRWWGCVGGWHRSFAPFVRCNPDAFSKFVLSQCGSWIRFAFGPSMVEFRLLRKSTFKGPCESEPFPSSERWSNTVPFVCYSWVAPGWHRYINYALPHLSGKTCFIWHGVHLPSQKTNSRLKSGSKDWICG